jgi:hypothetical protein
MLKSGMDYETFASVDPNKAINPAISTSFTDQEATNTECGVFRYCDLKSKGYNFGSAKKTSKFDIPLNE